VSLRKSVVNQKDVTESNKDNEDTQYSQIVDIQQSSGVNGPLDLDTITDAPEDIYSVEPAVERLEKLPRHEDSDIEINDEILDMQLLSETDTTTTLPTKQDSDEIKSPGSLLTKFIDGFFVPKQKHPIKKKKKNNNKKLRKPKQ
jgi:hypothetical protein